MIMQVTGYIPFQDRKFANFNYPNVVIEWTWEPPMSGIAGGASLFDFSIIIFVIALIANFIALLRKDKEA